MKAPYIGPLSENRMMLVEEDNPWPVAVIASVLSWVEQVAQISSMRQEWIQKGKRRARDENMGEMSQMSQKIAMGIALGFGVIIAIMAVMVMQDSGTAAEATAKVVG